MKRWADQLLSYQFLTYPWIAPTFPAEEFQKRLVAREALVGVGLMGYKEAVRRRQRALRIMVATSGRPAQTRGKV